MEKGSEGVCAKNPILFLRQRASCLLTGEGEGCKKPSFCWCLSFPLGDGDHLFFCRLECSALL